MKLTSYPSIALLISIFILVITFGLLFYGVGNYLERNRVTGLELISDLKNYNILQYYLYVLSDYEVRNSFFNVLSDIYNNSINFGVIEIQSINRKIWNESIYNNLEYDKWCNYVVGVYRTTDWIYGRNLLVIYPCINPIPFYNFSTNLNKNFLENIFNNFNFSIFESFKSFKDHYNFSLAKIENTSFYLNEEDFLVSQKINYLNKKDEFFREILIEVNYSLIPYAVLYNELLYKVYEGYVNLYIDFLKRFYRDRDRLSILNNIIPKKISDYNFEIVYSYKTSLYLPYFSFINDIFNFYAINRDKFNIYLDLYYPFFCSQLDYVFSSVLYFKYPKETINTCEITKIPPQEVIVYDYTIQECLLDDLVIEVNPLEINEIISEIIFYNFTFYDNLVYVDPKNLEVVRGIYDKFPIPNEIFKNPEFDDNKNNILKKNIENYIYKGKNYKDRLWTVDERQSFLIAVAIGEFYPVRCTIGYKYYSYLYDDPINCIEILKILRSDIYVKIITSCSAICTKWDITCTTSNGSLICRPVCIEEKYLLEYKRRAKSIYIDNNIENLSLALYYPIDKLSHLKYLIKQ